MNRLLAFFWVELYYPRSLLSLTYPNEVVPLVLYLPHPLQNKL